MNTKSIIMRRVYYSYTLSIFSQVVFWQGLFLGGATLVLGDWLHVASIFRNFLALPIANIPQYIGNTYLHALNNGEMLTVVMFTAATVVLILVGYKLGQSLFVKSDLAYTQV